MRQTYADMMAMVVWIRTGRGDSASSIEDDDHQLPENACRRRVGKSRAGDVFTPYDKLVAACVSVKVEGGLCFSHRGLINDFGRFGQVGDRVHDHPIILALDHAHPDKRLRYACGEVWLHGEARDCSLSVC